MANFLKLNNVIWNVSDVCEFQDEDTDDDIPAFGIEFCPPVGVEDAEDQFFTLTLEQINKIEEVINVLFEECNINTYKFLVDECGEEENPEFYNSIMSYKVVNYLKWTNDRVTEYLNLLYAKETGSDDKKFNFRKNFILYYGLPNSNTRYTYEEWDEAKIEDYELNDYFYGDEEGMKYARTEVSQVLEDMIAETLFGEEK